VFGRARPAQADRSPARRLGRALHRGLRSGRARSATRSAGQSRRAAERDAGSSSEEWGFHAPAGNVALELWDDDTARALIARQVELSRRAGGLTLLPLALAFLAGLSVHFGDLDGAAELLEEVGAITAATGNLPPALSRIGARTLAELSSISRFLASRA
jgi:hypothetical protein